MLGVRVREKVPLRVKGLVIKLSITVEVGSEGVVKGGGGGISKVVR